MIQLIVPPENRNIDPVRFFQNRIRVSLDNFPFWIDEDRLFSLLDNDQKRTYLTSKRKEKLILAIGESTARKMIEVGYSKNKKGFLANLPKTT